MKIFITSFDEPTVNICLEELEKFGFKNIILLNQLEDWFSKYRRFISLADEDCLRIDADVIINKNIIEITDLFNKQSWDLMLQVYVYDFYKNNVGISSPVLYKKRAIDIIKKNINKLDKERPEATAWRLPEINPFTRTVKEVCGMHGFFQRQSGFDRAFKNKIARKQIKDYDFELAKKLMDLYVLIN